MAEADSIVLQILAGDAGTWLRFFLNIGAAQQLIPRIDPQRTQELLDRGL